MVVEALVIQCVAATLDVGHRTAGGASRYIQAAAFRCHMYVGLHAPGWPYGLGMPPGGCL